MKYLLFAQGNLLCKKLIVQTKEEDKQNDQRQDISDVSAHPFPDLHAFSGVGFFCEVFPAPAVFACAEQHQQQAAPRQDVVRHEEVLDRLDIADAWNGNARKHVEPEHARDAQKRDERAIHEARLLAAHAPLVHRERHDRLEHGNHRRQRSKAHEQEEQRAPQLPQGHRVEHDGQRDEHKRRPRSRLHAEGEARREDDKNA